MINTRLPNILIPINKEALNNICSGGRGDDENYIIFSIGRNDLEELFNNDFFKELNNTFNLNIDEYEEEIIIDEEVLVNMFSFFKDRLELKENYINDFYTKKIYNCIEISLEHKHGLAFLF